jgi:hypothetical protein
LLVPEGFNEELSGLILLRAQTEPSHPSWNRGGWRSDERLLSWPSPAVQLLRLRVLEAFNEIAGYDTSHKRWRAWCLVNRDGSHHERHTHAGEWAGIYYVTSGSGDTVFEIPGGFQRVTPEAGLLVIAPSNVWHYVEPCLDTEPRITIAFEAR